MGAYAALLLQSLRYRLRIQIWKLKTASVVSPTAGLQNDAATGRKNPKTNKHFYLFIFCTVLYSISCWKLINVTTFSRLDRFEPAGCDHRETSSLLSLLLLAVLRHQFSANGRVLLSSPPWASVKPTVGSFVLLLFRRTDDVWWCSKQPEGDKSDDGISYTCRLYLFSLSSDWAVNLCQRKPVGSEMEKLKVIREK